MPITNIFVVNVYINPRAGYTKFMLIYNYLSEFQDHQWHDTYLCTLAVFFIWTYYICNNNNIIFAMYLVHVESNFGNCQNVVLVGTHCTCSRLRRFFFIWLSNFYAIFTSLNQFLLTPNQFLLNWGLWPVVFGADCDTFFYY